MVETRYEIVGEINYGTIYEEKKIIVEPIVIDEELIYSYGEVEGDEAIL